MARKPLLTEVKRKDLLKRTGMLFQQSALFDSQKVWENVAFVYFKRQAVHAQVERTSPDKLASVGMKEDVGELLPSEISGGMQNVLASPGPLPAILKSFYLMNQLPGWIR